MSDAEGYFFFANVPSGAHVLQSLHVGYREERFKVEVVAGDTTHVDLVIGHESLQVEGILIEGERKSSVSPLQAPEVVFSGSKLRQNLSRTIAETIAYEPGIAQRSMGPAPARPVLRGLGGDRLLMVEDGERTGDLSGYLFGPRRGYRADDHRAHRGRARPPHLALRLQCFSRGRQRGARVRALRAARRFGGICDLSGGERQSRFVRRPDP